jgi:chromate transporter
MSSPSAAPDEATAPARPASLAELFVAFTLLALQGFGGVLAVAQRVLVEQRRWLTKTEFVELLALAQVLPGPNVCNLALMIGDRYFGLRGALTALAGMMLLPLMIVIALTITYAHFAHVPQVAGALRGMGAVAAGLIIGTAFRLAGSLRGSVLGVPLAVVLGSTSFVAVALLRLPLTWVLLALGGSSFLLAYLAIARRASAGQD